MFSFYVDDLILSPSSSTDPETTRESNIRPRRTEEEQRVRDEETNKLIEDWRESLKGRGYVRKVETEEEKAQRSFKVNKFRDWVKAGVFDSEERRHESWRTYFEECKTQGPRNGLKVEDTDTTEEKSSTD